MAAPIYTPLPTAPARTMSPTVFAAAADAFVAALAVLQTEGDTLGIFTETQAEAALAAAIAGNLSELDLSALAGWVIGVNEAGDALEGVELVPPSLATETAAGIVEKATSAEGTTPAADKFPDTVVVEEMIDERVTPKSTEAIKKATTSGTEFDFTGIPAGTTEIFVNFDNVSLSGTDSLLVQIGDSGGIETTGYNSGSSDSSTALLSTSGMVVRVASADRLVSGVMHFVLMESSTNTWTALHGCVANGATDQAPSGGGAKALSAELTQLRITRTGTDTFDAGAVNILYR